MALRTLLATVDETIPVLPASTHREVGPHPEGSVAGGAQRTLCRRDLLAGPQVGTPATGRPSSELCGATAPRVGSRPEGRGVREDRWGAQDWGCCCPGTLQSEDGGCGILPSFLEFLWKFSSLQVTLVFHLKQRYKHSL